MNPRCGDTLTNEAVTEMSGLSKDKKMTRYSTLHDTEPASVEMPAASTLALHSEAMAHKPDPLACAYARIERLEAALRPIIADYDDLIKETLRSVCWSPDGKPDRSSAEPEDLEIVAHMERLRDRARAALAKDSGGKG